MICIPSHPRGYALIAMAALLSLPTLSQLTPAHAQVTMDAATSSGTERKTVRQVDVVYKGAVTLDANRVRAQMATRVGEPYLDEVVERDLRNLYATGAVENVDIRAVNMGGGVRVIVTISGRGAIGDLYFSGNSIFDNGKLEKEIEIKVGDPVDEAKLTAAQQKIRELYEKKGYADVLVSYETGPSAREGYSSVTFRISEGGRGIIDDIRFEGNNAISARKLKSKLKSKEKTFYRLFGKSGKLDNEAVQEDVRIIEQAYQDEGYVYVKTTYRKEVVDAKRIALIFSVYEGNKYDVASVNLSGVTVFSREDLMKAVRTDVGYPYSGSDIRGDEKMILDYYGSQGYADARVDTQLTEAGAGQIKVNFSVTEGQRSSIRKVNISGNNNTEDRIIRRELAFAPGDLVNTTQIEAAQTTLENMNYFEGKSDPNPLTVRAVDSGVPAFKDVEVNVTEKPTGSINFGAGLSSIDSLVGFIDVTQTNFDISDWKDFRGAGQRFNMNLRLGNQTSTFSTSWTEPWFLDQKLALTVRLFYDNLQFVSTRYDQINVGMSVGLRKPIGKHAYLEGTLTGQRVDIAVDTGRDENNTLFIEGEDGDYMQGKLDLNFVHDTRDSIFITRKGHKFEAGLTYSGLGGDVEFVGLNIGGQQFFNLPGDTILSFEGMARIVEGSGSGNDKVKGGADVPIYERLFLGGAYNLRGYDYREAGPKDSKGEPLGGNLSLFGSVEYSFPIIEKIRGAFFWDVGMISTDFDIASGNTGGQANGGPIIGDGEIYSNIGLGVRMILPGVGPIRLDLGLPMTKDKFTGDSPRFQFNMGYRF
jgi:outer membrane protein insertion porin family